MIPSCAPQDFFQGMRVLQSAYLEEDGEPIVVRRTWRHRLLTWPWKPLVKTYTVVPKIPYRGAVQLNATTLVMHPETWKRWKRLREGADQ